MEVPAKVEESPASRLSGFRVSHPRPSTWDLDLIARLITSVGFAHRRESQSESSKEHLYPLSFVRPLSLCQIVVGPVDIIELERGETRREERGGDWTFKGKMDAKTNPPSLCVQSCYRMLAGPAF